ncbi:MAG: AlpA family phage regulatory protein [Ferrovibrio sp.]|nr:AlpA family phage regulatory protein [Ferrovibrio sp.]
MTARYLSLAGLAQYLACSRSTINNLVASGRLPQPVYLTPKLPRWDREKVDEAMGTSAKSRDPVMEALDEAYPLQQSKAHTQRRHG